MASLPLIPACSESIKLRHSPHQDEWPYLHYARFTPAGNALVWVQGYDIYYRDEVRSSSVHRITQDAVPGVVYNGVPDWLYEGETMQSVIRYIRGSLVFMR